MRRIVYLVPALGDACVRQRVDAFLPALEQHGWCVEKWVIPRTLVGRLRVLRQTRRADVVVLLRKLLRPWQLWFLRKRCRRLVFDFDDAVMYRDTSREDPFSEERSRRFGETVRAADRSIAANAYLAGLAENFGGRPTVVPTCVDDGRLCPTASAKSGGKVVIGWIGSRSELLHLASLRPVFEALSRKYRASVALKVVSDAFPGPMGIEVVKKPWSLATELEDLCSFDIGILPLTDGVWTRGTCGFPLLQYLAVGIAAVASPVGVNSEILFDGETGFLAEDTEQWTRLLSLLIEDVGLRHNVGLLGRESLHGRYTVKDWEVRYVRLIEEVAGAAPRQPVVSPGGKGKP